MRNTPFVVFILKLKSAHYYKYLTLIYNCMVFIVFLIHKETVT